MHANHEKRNFCNQRKHTFKAKGDSIRDQKPRGANKRLQKQKVIFTQLHGAKTMQVTTQAVLNLENVISQGMQQTLASLGKETRALGIFLGGSQSRGTGDRFSDRDLGLIYQEELCPLSKAQEALINHFGEPSEIVAKELSIAHHFHDHYGRFEVRLTSHKTIMKVCDQIHTFSLIEPYEQDLASNILNGIYLHQTNTIKTIQDKIYFSDELQKKTINTYAHLIHCSELEKAIFRGDFYLILETCSELYGTGFLLGLAEIKQFCTSTKHEKATIEKFTQEAQNYLRCIQELAQSPSSNTFSSLKQSEASFKAKLLNHL